MLAKGEGKDPERFVTTGVPFAALPVLGEMGADKVVQLRRFKRGRIAALDYGLVYHWYNDLLVVPTYHTLTRYMYPITPMELHEGYIIGRERIITKKSGLFGWGDSAEHEVHVFDSSGREVPDFKAPLVRRNGKTYSELRLPEGWSAAVVRKVRATAKGR